MEGLRIGITIGLRNEAETLWNNGIKQNAMFLADALMQCPSVASAVLLNTTGVPVTDKLPWDRRRWPTHAFDDVKDALDVLVELGGQIDEGQTRYLKQRGVRLVSYCCGFEYVHAMESILFRRPLWGEALFVNQRYDDIWMIPQVENISRSYFEVLRRQSARVVPFIWSPIFIDQRSKGLPDEGRYCPNHAPKRLSVMEPNHDVVKFCLYPVLIAELAYRMRPNSIEILQVTNAESIARESLEFISLMHQLDIVTNHKAVFLGRHDTPEFLSRNTDIVISHQLENPLNYMYLEVCWQGYALVHNASLCADIGYFYPGNDAKQGAQQVINALDNHDAHATWYRERQRAAIGRYLPENPQLVACYGALLDDLMRGAIR